MYWIASSRSSGFLSLTISCHFLDHSLHPFSYPPEGLGTHVVSEVSNPVVRPAVFVVVAAILSGFG